MRYWSAPLGLRLPFAALATAISFALAGTAVAQESKGPDCSTFTAFLDADRIEFIDNGAEGPSAGDQRIGRYFLLDDDGNRIGEMEFVTVVLPPSEDGKVKLFATGHHTFANGALALSLIYELPDVTDTSQGGTTDLTHVITGGTGEFAHATGSITITTTADGRRRATYELKCH